MGVRSLAGLVNLAMEGHMADHLEAPIVAQDLGAFHFDPNDIPGVFASSWSKEFNGSDATRDAPGFREAWVFTRAGVGSTPTASLGDTPDGNAPVVASVTVPVTFDLNL
jgi:hypothetical protein